MTSGNPLVSVLITAYNREAFIGEAIGSVLRIEQIGRWDESLAANQDGDLVLRALLAGMRIQKADGGLGMYRKQPGSRTTISTTVSARTVRSRLRVFRKVEDALRTSGDLDRYRIPLGRSYYEVAREAYSVDLDTAKECEARAWALAGNSAPCGTRAHRFLAGIMGLRRKEWFARWIRTRVSGLRSPGYL